MEVVKAKQKRLLVNAGHTDWTLQEKTDCARTDTGAQTHTHTLRILDSYQGESEIRKLKSLSSVSFGLFSLKSNSRGQRSL